MRSSSNVTVITPATSKLLTTLANVKLELGITVTTDDTWLTKLITQASSAIAVYCNYTFGIERLQETFLDSGYVHRPKLGYFRSDAGPPLYLSKVPVTNIVSTTLDSTSYTSGTDYYLDAASGQMSALSGGLPTSWNYSNAVIIYDAGYALPGDPSPTLPDVVERACIDLVKYKVAERKRDPALRSETVLDIVTRTWTTGKAVTQGGLPLEIADLLEQYRVPVII